MRPEIKKYLSDIVQSTKSIEEYLEGKRNFDYYCNNKMLRRAVERELEIIGEAVNSILKIDKNIPIKNAGKIVALRNHVIHGYDSVDDAIIWGVVTKYIPRLQEEAEILLNE